MGRTKALGDQRHAHHAGSATNKPQVALADPVGVAGELIFARHFGLSPKAAFEIGADPGYDFVADSGLTVDVKSTAYQTPDGKGWMKVGLFADEGRVTADLYVLCYVDDVATERGRLLGWATREEMLAAPLQETQKPGTSYKIRGHRLHRSKIHPISTLKMSEPPPETGGDKGDPDLIREAHVILEHPVTVIWDSKKMVAYLSADNSGDPPIATVVYCAIKTRGGNPRAEWYDASGDKPYGFWTQAAVAALRRAMTTETRMPRPANFGDPARFEARKGPAPTPKASQNSLDF